MCEKRLSDEQLTCWSRLEKDGRLFVVALTLCAHTVITIGGVRRWRVPRIDLQAFSTHTLTLDQGGKRGECNRLGGVEGRGESEGCNRLGGVEGRGESEGCNRLGGVEEREGNVTDWVE